MPPKAKKNANVNEDWQTAFARDSIAVVRGVISEYYWQKQFELLESFGYGFKSNDSGGRSVCQRISTMGKS